MSKVAPNCIRFYPFHLVSGFSGAIVVRIDGFTSTRSTPDAQILLKCSRDRDKLLRELQNAPNPSEPSAHIYVPPATLDLQEVEGWFASAWRFRDDAMTLQDWLVERSPPIDIINQIFNRLFTLGLSRDHARLQLDLNVSFAKASSPAIIGKARISDSMTLLAPLISSVIPTLAFTPTNTHKFINDNMIADRPIDRIKGGTWNCICHGDLHSRNILVIEESSQALAIDPARRGVRPWPSDHAKLCADLWISCWASGLASHFWDQLVQWNRDFDQWLAGSWLAPEIDTPNNAVYHALNWTKANLEILFAKHFQSSDFPHWEFKLALAIEFLNLSCYMDIPTPKRAFALLSAERLLSQMGTSLPWIDA